MEPALGSLQASPAHINPNVSTAHANAGSPAAPAEPLTGTYLASSPAPSTSLSPQPKAAGLENSIKLGCGCGPIARALATHNPVGQDKVVTQDRSLMVESREQQLSMPAQSSLLRSGAANHRHQTEEDQESC